MNFKGNLYGPILWCLVFKENLYGPTALKVRRESSSRLVLVHGWLFPESWGFYFDKGLYGGTLLLLSGQYLSEASQKGAGERGASTFQAVLQRFPFTGVHV